MKRNVIVAMSLLGLLLTALSGIAAAQSLTVGRSAELSTSGWSQWGVVYARHDPRLCPSPACGGYNLFDGSQPTGDPCHAQLRFVHYVTGVFLRKDDGSVTRINPSCD